MNLLSLVSLLLATSASSSCVSAASIFGPAATENTVPILTKTAAAVGKSVAQNENISHDPLTEFLKSDLAKFLNLSGQEGVQGGLDDRQVMERIKEAIPDSEAMQKLFESDDLNEVFNVDMINNLMSGNFASLSADHPTHDKMDELFARLLNVEKEKVTATRKKTAEVLNERTAGNGNKITLTDIFNMEL